MMRKGHGYKRTNSLVILKFVILTNPKGEASLHLRITREFVLWYPRPFLVIDGDLIPTCEGL